MSIITNKAAEINFEDLSLDETLKSTGWKFASLDRSYPQILHNPRLDEFLMKGGEITFEKSSKAFNCGRKALIDDLVKDAQDRGKMLFNSEKIRLASDPAPFQRVQLEKTDYFQGLATNEFVTREWTPQNGFVHSGFEEAFPGQLVGPMTRSLMSNHIGVCAFAFDVEGVLSLASTSQSTMQAANKITASAGGSCDIEDFADDDNNLCSSVIKSVVRELSEEQGIDLSFVRAARLISFQRDLSRGGKPDFIACITLNETWSSARKELSSSEKQFTTGHVEIDCKTLGANGLNQWFENNSERLSFSVKQNRFALEALARTFPDFMKNYDF